MDANRMLFADESFDFITSTFALHHWKSPCRVFNEIHRLLKPGCEAWIYDGLAEAPIKAIRKWMQPFPGFPPARLLRLVFKTHGFGEADYEDGIRAQAQASSFGGCRLEPEMVFMKLVLNKPAQRGG
jgi:ubiquinone/menaquinone biosynthesis C-methylase UbiE